MFDFEDPHTEGVFSFLSAYFAGPKDSLYVVYYKISESTCG